MSTHGHECMQPSEGRRRARLAARLKAARGLALPLGLALALAACANPTPEASASAGGSPLRYLGQQILPPGLVFDGTTVGGLSALDFDPQRGVHVALSDDRGTHGPPRTYTLALDLAAFRRAAEPGRDGVRLLAVTPLRRPDGGAHAVGDVDPEGLRLDPTRARLFWSDEGQRRRIGAFLPPAVRVADLQGREIARLPLPEAFLPRGSAGGGAPGDAGVRDNLALESLALTPDGRTLCTASESALAQDGDLATLERGTRVRLWCHAVDGAGPGLQVLLTIEPIARRPLLPGLPATNGLTELLALGDGRFIALERSFSAGATTPGQPSTGVTARLFLVDIRGATDVSAMTSTQGADVVPARKRLLLDLSTLRHDDGTPLAVDNLEGLAWGPSFEGRRTLILVSDDNFSSRQFTQFVALVVDGPLD